jgi:hypothetical protein
VIIGRIVSFIEVTAVCLKTTDRIPEAVVLLKNLPYLERKIIKEKRGSGQLADFAARDPALFREEALYIS